MFPWRCWHHIAPCPARTVLRAFALAKSRVVDRQAKVREVASRPIKSTFHRTHVGRMNRHLDAGNAASIRVLQGYPGLDPAARLGPLYGIGGNIGPGLAHCIT